MKVLLIAPACDGEDVGESWVASQWAQLLASRVDLTLLSSYKHGHTPPSEQLPGVRVIEWPEPPGVHRFERLNSLMQPGYAPFHVRSRRWIRDRQSAGERFDVAHQVVPVAMRYPCPATGLGMPVVIGPVGGSLDSPPAFTPEEGSAPWWQRLRALDAWRIRHDPMLRRTYRDASCVLGIAPYVREYLTPVPVRRLEIMSEVAVHTLPEPVDRSDRAGPIRLLWVGRVVRTKGLRDVIRALAQLTDLDLHLDAVGDGNDRDSCADLIDELGQQDRITLHGRLPREKIDEFYRAADVFVFPSYREPGGNVTLEAMAFGLPVIVCERGGPGANVSDACAFRLEAQSPSELAHACAEAIRTLATDRELRLRMGAAARDHVLANHLWSARLERMLQIYRDVTAADSTTRPSLQ